MAKGFFITGTDTGVGKTVVASAFIRALWMLGIKACGMKPVETGCPREGDVLIPRDGEFLKNIAHMEEGVDQVTPVRLESPLAPYVAAGIEGRKIDTSLCKREFKRLSRKYGAVVVEGIGGILVPVAEDYFVMDMIREFDLPLVIVARPTLGTINHTLLTVRQALGEGLTVAGVVINSPRPPGDGLDERTNPAVIEEFCGKLRVPLLGTIAHLKEGISPESIERAAAKGLKLALIKEFLV
jgi:dethiobiotin synthetase